MKLDVYRLRDIQTFIALAAQFEAEGITDVRFVRVKLSEHLRAKAGEIPRVDRRRYPATAKQPPRPDYGKCPQCDKPLWPVDTGDNDITILGCWGCRFSKMVD